MKIVIDIPEKKVKDPASIDLFQMVGAIKNGTPLPKGHGRLIDASQLMTITDIRADGSEVSYVFCDEIEDAPTIIEAEKVESEE